MELIEIVVGSDTEELTVTRLREFCDFIGKSPVLVKDSPGFIVNRLMSGQINQAVKMLEEGVATVDDIDKAVKLGLLHPIGPLALADLIGLDVLQRILNTLFEKTGDETFKSSACLDEKVRQGWLGRKSGKGFYVYKK